MAERVASDQWWREFGDPDLDNLVTLAIRQNDDQQIAIARVAEAKGAARLAQAALLPSVNVHSMGERESGISPFGLADQDSSGGFDALITYDPDVFGTLRNERAAAKAQLLEAEALRDWMRLSVATVVADSYVNLRALDARLEIAQSTLRLRAESLQVARRRYTAGYSTALDLKQAEAEYLSTQQLIPELQSAIRKQEDALSVFVGNVPGSIRRGARLEDLRTPALPYSLPATVVRQRPDVYAAEQDLAATDQSLSAVRAGFLPNIALEAGAGRAFSTLFPEPITIWSIGGSILAPIFEGGALHARQDIAAARRDQAAFVYRRAVLTAFKQVEDQMTIIDETADRIQILVAQKDALEAATRLATRRYRTGYSTYLDQLDAERGLLNAQLAVVQAKAAHLLAFIDLFRAIGGGWHASETLSADIHAPGESSK